MTTQSRTSTPESRRPPSARWKALGVVCFVAFLWLPLVESFLAEDLRESRLDNRNLAAVPSLDRSPGEMQRLPADLGRYYDDHIGFRSAFIQTNAWIRIRLLGVSPSTQLIVGRDHWFYLGDTHALAQYQGLARFDEPELARWLRVLEERHRWLSERGVAYLVVFVPNKPTIYPEFMPRNLPRLSEHSQLGQLIGYLQLNSTLPILDLRPDLLAARQNDRVYHRTDTHWNDLGAYLAYERILSRLGTDARSFEPAPVRFARRRQDGLGLVRIVGLSKSFPEETLALELTDRRAGVARAFRAEYVERVKRQLPIAFERSDNDLPRAVMFRDSFANALIPYLSENFSRILYVWNMNLLPRIIERERPDYVIQQFTERMLWQKLRTLAETRADPPP